MSMAMANALVVRALKVTKFDFSILPFVSKLAAKFITEVEFD